MFAYSLGNFLSSQWSLDRRTGAILYVDLVRDHPQGRVVAKPAAARCPRASNRYAENGVTVTPPGLVADGAPSIAHAAAVLGEGRLLNPAHFRVCRACTRAGAACP